MNTSLTALSGVGPTIAAILSEYGFNTVEDIAATDVASLCSVPGFGPVKAEAAITEALELSRPQKTNTKKPKKKKAVSKSKKPKKSKQAAKKAKSGKKEANKKSDKKSKSKRKSKKADKKKKKKK